jgi:hypothetical protein
MVDVITDITEWRSYDWIGTGGTRPKNFVESPEGQTYYFKESIKTYKYEFWSEILAYKLGDSLGFNVLPYELAFHNDKIGCLSENMIDNEVQSLIEGGKYLTSYDGTFDPSIRSERYKYNFQLIEEALEHFSLEKFIGQMVELVIFDLIIGNSDRHQENWAFIHEYDDIEKRIVLIEKLDQDEKFMADKSTWARITRGLRQLVLKGSKDFRERREFGGNIMTFAPFYDNGSSLARELDDDKIERMLVDSNQLNSYVLRGKSEIHWKSTKLKHFEFLHELRKTKHYPLVNDILRKIIANFNEEIWHNIIDQIDTPLPERFNTYKLTFGRKSLLKKIVTLRIEKLKEIIN